MNKFLKITVAISGAIILGLASAPVFAEDGSTTPSTGPTSNETGTRDPTSNTKEQAQEKIKEAREKVCSNRKTSAGNVETRVIHRGQKRLDAYTKIAERAEKFYADKGLTVTNYDTLVADVNAKKSAAQTAVDTLSADKGQLPSVACGNGTGKPAIEKFKTDLKAEQNALKAYKTSIKTLLQAIKAAKTTATGEGEQ
jgi:hypothetical protein